MTVRILQNLKLLTIGATVLLAGLAQAQIPSRIIVNPSFEIPNLSAPGVCTPGGGITQRYLPDSSYSGTNEANKVLGWRTTDDLLPGPIFNCPAFTLPYRPIEYFRTPTSGSAADGQQWAELNAENPRRLYQNVCLVAGESVPYTFRHRARFDAGVETARAAIYASDGTTLISAGVDFTATSTITWDARTGVLTNTGSSGLYQYGFEARVGAGGTPGVIGSGRANEGNFIDDVRITLRPLADINRFVDASSNTLSSVGESRGTIFLEVIVNGTVQGSGATITLTRSGAATTTDISVGSSTNRTGATVSANANGDITLSIPAGEYDPNAISGSQVGAIRIPITIANDSSVEGNEPLTYTITAVSNPGAPAGAGLATEINGQSARCTTAVGNTTLTIQDEADLAVEKTGPATATQGDTITYTIKVWNRGPTPVSGASFTDSVPSTLTGVTWTCAASGSAVCGTASGSGNSISVSTGALPVNTAASNPISGSYLTFTVSGTASSAGSLVNTARITAPGSVVDPSGSNNASSVETLVAGPPPSISGTVYNDNNGNSTLNIGEPRLANITVELLSGSTVIQTQSTDSEGNYLFTGMGPGTYTVRVSTTDPDLPPGSSLTTPNNLSVTVVAGSAVGNQNFGFRRTALDVIKSAGTVQQVGATAFVVPFTLVVGNTGQLPTPNVQVTENLSRTFPGASSIVVVAGSLSVTPSSGATCTLNGAFNGTSDTRLLSGSNTLTAGQSCTIGFSVRVEYPAGGVPVVPQNNTAYASSRSTGPNPGYTFPGGVPTPPSGAVATDESTNTSNPTPAGLPSTPGGDAPSPTPVSLSANPGTIAGTLYNDQNNNGALDGSEPRLPAGVSVELLSGSTVVATTQTDASGNYSFNGVAPGSYTVRVVATDPDIPAGLVPSAPATGSAAVSVTGGATTTQNFGFQPVRIDTVKSAGVPTQVNANTFDVPIAVVVGNTGNVPAPNVQVSENLSRTFPGASSITVPGGLSVTPSSGATCTANGGFNGTSVFGLLSGTDDLAPGQSCTITFTVRVQYPSSGAIPSDPQNNQVYASSRPDSAGATNPGHTFPGGTPTPPSGAVATDTSTNTSHPAGPGSLPSAPGGDTPSATPISLTPNPGSISGTLYLDRNSNGSFDSGTDPRLGANISVELVDGSGTVIATVQTDASGNYSFASVNPGTYTVRVVTSDPDLRGAVPTAPASGALSVTVSPGTPSNNQNFGFGIGALDVIKSAGAPSQIDARTFQVSYTVVAGNTGTQTLPNVQLTENLSQTFATGSPSISLEGGPTRTAGTATCTVNSGFNGTSDTRLLTGSDTWQVGEHCTITFTVRVQYPDAASVPSAPQNNSVYASSTPTGPNPGHTFPGGTPTPPPGATATDTSSNTTNPATPAGLPATPGGDTPGSTPVSFVSGLGSISGVLYNDLNGNKSFDGTPTDSRLGAGITVKLLDGSGNVVSSTTTDSSGNYSFDAVAPGTYSLRVPTGAANPALGTLQPVAPPSAQIGPVSVAAGTALNNRNFGFNNPPVAVSDAASTPHNTPVTFSAVGNDSDPDGFVDPATIDLDPSTPGEQKTRTVPGQGTFSVDSSGNVTFTPEPAFSGTATIPYTVRDNTGNLSNPANLSVTVQPPQPPVAVNDEASTLPSTPVTLDPKANDSTPNNGASIVPGSVVFPASGQPAGSTRSPDGKTLTVPGQGTYVINPDGSVTFTPLPTFVGPATPVTYTFQDSTGQTSNPATIRVEVSSPAAVDDTASTPFNTPVSLDPKANDLVAPGRSLNPASVVFPAAGQPAGSTRSPDGKTLTVPGEGTYQIQPDGSVTFTPAPTFSGPTTPVQYTIADNTGAVSNPASIQVTVGPPAPPVASPDTASTPFGTPVTLDPAANDTAGPGTTLLPGSIDLDPSTPGQQTTRTVPGQGRFDLDPSTGQVTFTPEPGFAGTAQIPYTIQDSLGQTSSPSTLTVNVTPPPAPVARDDAKAGDFNQPVTVPAILNDSPSPGTILVPSTIDLDPSTPEQETSRTIPGKGTFTVLPDGSVRFDPVPGFEGTAVVPYTIRDNLGQTSNPANIAVTIRPRPAPPTARDDSATTPEGRPVTLNAAANDSANLPYTIDPASIDLDPSTPGQQTSLTVPGRGTFEAQPDGTVVFTPVPGFTGAVSIPYTINDQDSDPTTSPQTSNRANLTVTVTELPAALDDRATTPVNTPVSVPVVANDATNPGQSIVPSTIDLDPSTPGQQTSVSVPGQGTFALQPDGTVRFTPEPGFVGTATTPYTVQDSSGVTTSPANIVVTVTPPAPTAADDTATTPFRTPVTLYPSTNDTPGAGGQLLPSTIDLDPSTPGQQTERVVPGKGRFVLQPATNLNNESVQFIPEGDFTGPVSIPYTIQDNFGQTSSQANLTVVINPPTAPIANNDLASTRRDTPVSLNPAGNDTPGAGTSLDPRTIDLDPSTPGQQTRLELPGQGVFELQPDGTVRFTPAPGFTGTVQAPYTIADTTGQTSNTARLVVTVNPLPAAESDRATTPFNTPVTLNPLANDTPSDGATFDPATLDLDPLTPGVQESLNVPGKGTFTRNPDGSVTFTPAPGFTGTVTIPYTVQDRSGGTTNTADISVTVQAPAVPVARDDSASTGYNTPVTLNPIANDTPGAGASLDPSTLDLDPATPGIQDRVTVPGKGTFERNPDGSVTFTPVDGFTGNVEVPYTIRDNAGQESNPATIRIEVRGPNLLLEKTAVQGVARIGGSLEYILRATNQGSGATMRQVTLSDLLPVGLEYRAGSSTLNGTPVADPQITNEGGRQRLVWVIGDLASGQSASLRFATTVTASAPTSGSLVNTAEASALIGSSLNPVRVNSNLASATVKLEAGVFSDKGTILGRVYFDKNNDNNFTSGIDEPLQGVRVYLSDGRYAVTDEQGRYSLTEVLPGLNTLRVDRLTVPYVPKAVPDDRGLRGTRQVRVEGAGIYTEDFLFEMPAGAAQVTRSTRLSVDGQRLEKTVTQVASGSYTVTLTLTLNKAVNNLRISDPLPNGASRGAVTAPNLQPNVQGNEIRLGNLQAGTYTLTYTLSGNIPIDRLVTDPDLFWEEVR